MTFAGVPSFKPLAPLVYRKSYGYYGFMPPISIGIARGALEAFIREARVKRQMPVRSVVMSETEQVQELVARCRGLLDAARAHMLWTWEQFLLSDDGSGVATDDAAAAYHIAIVQSVDAAVEVVDRLHRALGTPVIFDGSPLDRAFRDVHTAAQHIVVSPARYVSAGRALLGLDPGTSMF
jgi:alkylation response protein AidB-like acyl-CoA dehydrogenase